MPGLVETNQQPDNPDRHTRHQTATTQPSGRARSVGVGARARTTGVGGGACVIAVSAVSFLVLGTKNVPPRRNRPSVGPAVMHCFHHHPRRVAPVSSLPCAPLPRRFPTMPGPSHAATARAQPRECSVQNRAPTHQAPITRSRRGSPPAQFLRSPHLRWPSSPAEKPTAPCRRDLSQGFHKSPARGSAPTARASASSRYCDVNNVDMPRFLKLRRDPK